LSTSHVFLAELEEQELKMKRLEQRYADIQVAGVVEKYGSAKVRYSN
jgi:cytoplasmic FMR1 interacting protein